MRKLLLIFTTFLVSCGIFEKRDPLSIESNRISTTFLASIDRQRYTLCGIGGAFPSRVIKGFRFSFDTKEDFSEEEAEHEITQMYESFSRLTKYDEGIRPYISDWPFQNEETKIDITFSDPYDNYFRRAPKIAVIGIKGGEMYKFYYDPDKDRLMNKTEFEEYKQLHGIHS
jgi:hypothetical protein